MVLRTGSYGSAIGSHILMERKMVAFYLICFILSLILLALVSSSVRDHTCFNLALLITVLTIANGGFLALALSEDLKEALVASIMVYAGGTFLPMLYFLVTCEICSLKIPRVLNLIMYGGQMLIYAAACTLKYNTMIYEVVEFHQDNGAAYLTKVYGPWHMIYVLSVYFYMFCTAVVSICSTRKRNKVSFKDMVSLICIIVFGVGVYVVERLLHWQCDIMPAVYLIMFATMLRIHYRASVFSTEDKVGEEYGDLAKVGCVSFNKKLYFMSYNDYAGSIFPELTKYDLDTLLPEDDTEFENKIMKELKEHLDGRSEERVEKKIFKLGENYYEYRVDLLYSKNGRWYGYLLLFNDVTDHQRYLNMIKEYNETLQGEVEAKTERIRDIQEKTLLGLAQMVESRDLSTGGHIKRTSSVVSIFAKALLQKNMGFTQEFLRYVERSAPMHDLGKIAVDDAILRKQAKFTPEEYEMMKTHAAAGYEIVKKILTGLEEDRFVEIAANVAHYHHEKVNGQGYPDGLVGDEIPVEARIMALADVFDALVSKRCYKEAFSYDKAFSIIEEDAGSHFDKDLAEVFLTCRPQLIELYESFKREES